MKSYYHVAPRYTPGSPAMVDEATARRVAKQEAEAFDYVYDGREGDAAKARAKALGPERIAEVRLEISDGWRVEDLITGRTYYRSFSYRVTWSITAGLRIAHGRKVTCAPERTVPVVWVWAQRRLESSAPPDEDWCAYVEKPIEGVSTIDAVRVWAPGDEPKHPSDLDPPKST